MASSRAALEQIHAEFTECTICSEIYTDPRMLPCLHTYCLRCLVAYGGKDSRQGSSISCPLCRKTCTLGANGFQALPKNTFIDRLVELRKISSSSVETYACDICLDCEDAQLDTPAAEFYCLDCRLKMCHECSKAHSKQPMTKTHKTTKFSTEHQVLLKQTMKTRPVYCDKHSEEKLRLFCANCSTAICLMCFALEHKTHNCSDIEQQATKSLQQLDEQTAAVSALIQHDTQLLDEYVKQRAALLLQFQRAEQNVRARSDEMKRIIDEHTSTLLKDLESIQKQKLKELEAFKDVIDFNLTMMETFQQFALELKQNGSHVDITQLSRTLQSRRQELACTPCPRLPDFSIEFVATKPREINFVGGFNTSRKSTISTTMQPCRKCGRRDMSMEQVHNSKDMKRKSAASNCLYCGGRSKGQDYYPDF